MLIKWWCWRVKYNNRGICSKKNFVYQFEICEFSVPCLDVLFDDEAVVVDGARVGFSFGSRPEGFCCLASIGGGGKFRWKSSIILSIADLSSSMIGTSRLAELEVRRGEFFSSIFGDESFDIEVAWRISEMSLISNFCSSWDLDVCKTEKVTI